MNAENSFGIKIRQLRKSMGLTQEQLAEKVGIDNKHLSKIENGLHLPTYKTIKKLFDVLGVDFNNAEQITLPVVVDDPNYLKSIKILHSAQNSTESAYFYEVLRVAQKGLQLNSK